MFRESETVELKAKVTPELPKEVVAFANSSGGTIYIGVENDGTPTGVEDPDQAVLQINNMIRDSVLPDVTMFTHYRTQETEGKRIVVVQVERGAHRPYYLAGKGLKPSGVYVRSGSASDPASESAIRRMIKETDGDRFEDMRSLCQEFSFQEAAAEFQRNGIAFGEPQKITLGVMTAEGIYTNLGYLLSDQCPPTIKTAVFSGRDKSAFQDRRDYSGSLFHQMNDAYQFIDIHNQTKAVFDGLYRIDRRDYPETAVREALLNCIIHRDYSFSAFTMINIFSDRMEFISVGGLYGGVSLRDVMMGLSICRNEKLAAVFYRLRLIEAYGTGIPKIMSAYEGDARKPTIEAGDTVFKLVLPNRNSEMPTEGKDSREYELLRFIQEKGEVSRSEIDALLGVSQATSGRLIRKLCNNGAVVRRGSGKNVKYSVV